MNQSNGTRPSTTNGAPERITLAIVGGGIAGLCLALGISNHAPHIDFHIYEAAKEFSEIGAGVALSGNAHRALWNLDQRLGHAHSAMVSKNVESNTVRSNSDKPEDTKETYFRFVMGMDHKTNQDFKSGKEVCETFCKGGLTSIHRAKFLEQLVALLPEHVRKTCVTFGARLKSAETVKGDSNSIKLEFANGNTAIANAVIGCDGVRSRVRRILLPEHEATPAFTGKYAYRGLVPMHKAAPILGDRSARNAHNRIGYGGHVLSFPIDKGNTMNVVAFNSKKDGQWPVDSDWIQHATPEEICDDFKDWSEEVKSIVSMMENTDKWALFDHPPASTYHKEGLICLIGDSAHASTPHHGAGAGFAVEDAALLSNLLSQIHHKTELKHVFAAYEAMRKERTQKLVRRSREQGMIYDFEAEGYGDNMEKLAEILPRRSDWIWDYDVDMELEEAIRYLETMKADST